jgi:hypothetical protein
MFTQLLSEYEVIGDVAVFQDSSVALCRQLALHCQLSFFAIVNHLALFKVGLDV